MIQWAERGGDNIPFVVCDGDNIPDDYTHLVIDTAARPTDEDLLALAETSDLLVVPCTPTTFALEATIATLATLPSEKYRILLTVVPPKPSREGEKAQKALKQAGLPVFKPMIRRFAAYLKAENAGLPVSQIRDPKSSDAWFEYQAVGKEMWRVARK